MRRLIFHLFLLFSIIAKLESAEPLADISRPWSPHDYAILSENVASRTLLLPLGSSEEKKKLLDRIISKENLEFAADVRISPLKRFTMLADIQKVIGEILLADLQAMDHGAKIDIEVAKLSSFSLDWVCSALRVLKELQAPEIPLPKPELTTTRISGMVEAFTGTIDCLQADNLFSYESRFILASKLETTLPQVWREFPSAARAQMLFGLKQLATRADNGVTLKVKSLINILASNEANQATVQTSASGLAPTVQEPRQPQPRKRLGGGPTDGVESGRPGVETVLGDIQKKEAQYINTIEHCICRELDISTKKLEDGPELREPYAIRVRIDTATGAIEVLEIKGNLNTRWRALIREAVAKTEKIVRCPAEVARRGQYLTYEFSMCLYPNKS